jgi:hypothetical protein
LTDCGNGSGADPWSYGTPIEAALRDQATAGTGTLGATWLGSDLGHVKYQYLMLYVTADVTPPVGMSTHTV